MTREEAITNYITPAIRRTWNDKKCKDILEALDQELKTGHLIIYDIHGHKACKCSECGIDVGYPCNDKYCPNCGTKMRGDKV